MTRRDTYLLIIIFLSFTLALGAIMPLSTERLGRKGFQMGLDLQGGTHLVYSVDLSKKDPSQKDTEVMEAVMQKIEMRVDKYGVVEPVVQTIQNEYGNFILIQLPGVKDIDGALKLIGETGQLDFREEKLDNLGKPVLDTTGNPEWVIATGTSSDGSLRELTGSYFKPNAMVNLMPPTNEPVVEFEWNSEGALLFEQVTRRNLNKPLGIFLDNELISAPTVRSVIKDRGVIEGMTVKEARALAIQLNSGSLDAPLTLVERRDVGAALGADDLRRSLVAGTIGAALVVLYMIMFYRVSGLVACLALAIYTVLNLAVFKLIPVTLTLPGIAGFFVSVGMGVDGNILVAERLKEVLRSGSTLRSAVEEAFRQSWTAIWDSNVTVFIACAVLYWLGGKFGNFMVVGFAATLFIGTALSMFTQVVVTRTFLRIVVSKRVWTSPGAYGVLDK